MRTVRVVAALIPGPSPTPGAASYLVQQRLPTGSRANLWEFPGGKVEPGESDEAALQRECDEELGVSLEVGEKLWQTVHAYSDFAVDLTLYGARVLKGKPEARGAQALRFCTAEQMKELPFCEADLPLIDRLVEGSLPGAA